MLPEDIYSVPQVLLVRRKMGALQLLERQGHFIPLGLARHEELLLLDYLLLALLAHGSSTTRSTTPARCATRTVSPRPIANASRRATVSSPTTGGRRRSWRSLASWQARPVSMMSSWEWSAHTLHPPRHMSQPLRKPTAPSSLLSHKWCAAWTLCRRPSVCSQDCFARGTRYPAGTGCASPCATVRAAGLSLALFAPGWSVECGAAAKCLESEDAAAAAAADRRFWEALGIERMYR